MEHDPPSKNEDFLGTGWAFPIKFSPGGDAQMLSGQDDIRSSLEILLRTKPGERPLHPDYGVALDDLLYEPVSASLRALVADNLRMAILIHEPRVNLLAIEFEDRLNEGRLDIRLFYAIRSTNSRFNLVYPFYLTDSSEQRTIVGS